MITAVQPCVSIMSHLDDDDDDDYDDDHDDGDDDNVWQWHDLNNETDNCNEHKWECSLDIEMTKNICNDVRLI